MRDYLPWLKSAWKQLVCFGSETSKLDEFIKKYKRFPIEQALKFIEIFGKENFILRIYNPLQLIENDTCIDFSKQIEFKIDETTVFPKKENVNEVQPQTLELKREINKFNSKVITNNQIIESLKKVINTEFDKELYKKVKLEKSRELLISEQLKELEKKLEIKIDFNN